MSTKTLIYSALLLFLLYGLFTVGFPLLLAFLLAFLLEPIIMLLSKKAKIMRNYASIIICTMFIIVLIGFSYLLIVKVSREIPGLSKFLLNLTGDIQDNFSLILSEYQHIFLNMPPAYQNSLQQISISLLNIVQQTVGQLATVFFSLATQIPNILIDALIIFIALYLISLSLPDMKKNFLSFFVPEDHNRVELVLKKLQNAIFGFIRAQIIISLVIFLVVLAGFIILKIKYASVTALIITMVDILPILGTGSIIIPMSIYQFFQGNIFIGTGLLIHYGAIVAVRRIIEPKILGESIGISALATLVSMYIGIQLAGFIGIFLGPAVIILFQALLKVGILKINIKF